MELDQRGDSSGRGGMGLSDKLLYDQMRQLQDTISKISNTQDILRNEIENLKKKDDETLRAVDKREAHTVEDVKEIKREIKEMSAHLHEMDKLINNFTGIAKDVESIKAEIKEIKRENKELSTTTQKSAILVSIISGALVFVGTALFNHFIKG
jgi:seryl-tRNA synthetase